MASGDTNTPRTDLSWSIGGSTYGEMIPKFEGQIDEVAIFGATLTQETIRDWMYREYNSDHPNWADLGAYYKMSDGTGTTLSDNSGGASSFPGTFIGTPDWVHSGAFAGPRNALEFDGLDDVVLTPGTTSLDLSSGQTFGAWVKPGNWSNGLDTPLAVKGDGLVPATNYYFGKSSGDTLLFSYDNGGRVYVPAGIVTVTYVPKGMFVITYGWLLPLIGTLNLRSMVQGVVRAALNTPNHIVTYTLEELEQVKEEIRQSQTGYCFMGA